MYFLNEVLSLNAQEFLLVISVPTPLPLLNEVLSLNAQEYGPFEGTLGIMGIPQ